MKTTPLQEKLNQIFDQVNRLMLDGSFTQGEHVQALAKIQALLAEMQAEADTSRTIGEPPAIPPEEAQNLYQLLKENSRDAILFIRYDNGQIIEANQAAQQLYGYTYAELLSLNITDLRSVDSLPRSALQMEQAYNTGLTFETLHLKKSGEVFPVEVSSRGVNFKKTPILLSVIRDLSERNRAQSAIQASEEKYRQLFENMTTAFALHEMLFDPSGRPVDYRFLEVNPAFEKLTGLNEADIRGKTVRDVLPHTEQYWIDTYGQVAQTGQPLAYENYSEELNRYYDVWAFSPQKGQFATIFSDISDRRLSQKALQRQLERLEALRIIDLTIIDQYEMSAAMDICIDQVMKLLKVDAVSVLDLNPDTRMLEYAAGKGFYTPALTYTHLPLGKGFAGRAAAEQRIIIAADLRVDRGEFGTTVLPPEEGLVTYIGVPLVVKEHVSGVMELFFRAPFQPDEDWLSFLQIIAGQIAISIDNTWLRTNLENSHKALEHAYNETLEGWSKALDLRDEDTLGHTRRVADLTVRLATTLGLGEQEIINIRRGALLHDIGKMGIPDSILKKAGPLSSEEWETMKQHPMLAKNLLAPIGYLHTVIDIPLFHHEKWDGSGYPIGLKEEVIPLPARIFAVVDVWDALRSDRPYRKAWSKEKALEYIRTQSGIHFDPAVAAAFLEFAHEL